MKKPSLWLSLFLFTACAVHPVYRYADQAETDLVISLDRTPCFGSCPIYTVEIYDKDNRLVFDGKRFTDQVGLYQGQVTEEEVAAIKAKVREIDFLSFQDRYDGPITDIPATITTLKWGGESKAVVNRYRGPEKLKELEQLIDETWKKHASEMERLDEARE